MSKAIVKQRDDVDWGLVALRVVAKAALRGNKYALEDLKRYAEELKREYSWLPEIKELIEKGLI